MTSPNDDPEAAQREAAETLAEAKKESADLVAATPGRDTAAPTDTGEAPSPTLSDGESKAARMLKALRDDDIEVDEELLAKVQKAIHTLAKTLKIFRTYPRENTISINAIDELTNAFTKFLDRNESLELFVDRHELQWCGIPVYSETDQRTSFALRLDRDGVRRLVFHAGIEQKEVVGLLEALTTEIDEGSLEDDMVSLLREKQLSHVKVYVLDDLSSGEAGFDEGLVAASDSGDAPTHGTSRGSSSSSSPGPALAEDADDGGATQTALCSATKAKLQPLTDKHAMKLKIMTEREETYDLSEDLTDILFDILQSETHEETYVNAMKVLVELVMVNIRIASFGQAADVLGRLRALAATEEVDKGVRARLVERLQALADKTRMDTLIKTLRDLEGVDKGDLSRFLTMLPASAAPHLCELMDLERYDDIAQTAVKHLVKDNPKVLTPKLAGPNVETAKKVLAILEQLADDQLAPALLDPLTAAQDIVKEASVHLLTKLKGPTARQLLLNYVTADNPTLRKTALKGLGQSDGTAGPAAALRAHIAARDFSDRTLAEKKSLLTTLARLETYHALDVLGEILTRKKWFEKQTHADTRACAALALGEIDDDRARVLLEQHLSDKSEAVKTAARLALSKNQQTTATVGSRP